MTKKKKLIKELKKRNYFEKKKEERLEEKLKKANDIKKKKKKRVNNELLENETNECRQERKYSPLAVRV